MDVAVIIPVWNRARIVPDTLDTLDAQERHPRTVVVVDDGSTDGTPEAVRAWGAARPRPFRLELRESAHVGAGEARNLGVAHAGRHDYIHFLDSDDLLPADFYARMESRFAPEVDAVSCDQVYVNAAGETFRSRSLARIEDDPLVWIARHDAGIFSTTCLRWELFEKFGPLDPRPGSGADFIFLLAAANEARWRWSEGDPVRYRVEGDNLGKPTIAKALRWARTAERLLPGSRLSPRRKRHFIARRWRDAGNIAMEYDNRRVARRCFERAMRRDPLYLAPYRKWLKTYG